MLLHWSTQPCSYPAGGREQLQRAYLVGDPCDPDVMAGLGQWDFGKPISFSDLALDHVLFTRDPLLLLGTHEEMVYAEPRRQSLLEQYELREAGHA